MAATIDYPVKRELQSVISFLQAEGLSEAEIHRRISRVHGQNFMNDSVLRRWCRKFKFDELMFMMKVAKDESLSQKKTSLNELIEWLETIEGLT